jgi:hypothetical protein
MARLSMKPRLLRFYGENNVRLASSVQVTIAAMEERVGKVYEVVFQRSGRNTAAIEDTWPKAIAFLKKHIG